MSKASEAKSVFQALDTNGDGELDAQELQCRLSDFGVEVGFSRRRCCVWTRHVLLLFVSGLPET